MALMASTLTGYVPFPTHHVAARQGNILIDIAITQEYPGADDRGGEPEDGVNFTLLLKELQEAIKKQPMKYIVSFTAPTSYWYLRHFDLKAVDYVDFVNVMSYE
jgi:GH18 family chitinase